MEYIVKAICLKTSNLGHSQVDVLKQKIIPLGTTCFKTRMDTKNIKERLITEALNEVCVHLEEGKMAEVYIRCELNYQIDDFDLNILDNEVKELSYDDLIDLVFSIYNLEEE